MTISEIKSREEHTVGRPTAGTVIGAGRWPCDSCHPDAWGKPWSGVALEVDDPRAWANTLAFPTPTPDPDMVVAHVIWCYSSNLPLDDKIPVLWHFDTGEKVYWEPLSSVCPYNEDQRAWEEARKKARETWT